MCRVQKPTSLNKYWSDVFHCISIYTAVSLTVYTAAGSVIVVGSLLLVLNCALFNLTLRFDLECSQFPNNLTRLPSLLNSQLHPPRLALFI